MEAETLKRKKTTINKGKIKKTIKNVICRPDPVAWPLATTEETEEIKLLLNKYSVPIPKFKKLPWKELKLIPKNERPKQPTAPKVSGLIFGMSECRSSLNVKKISALLVESTINPRTIIQPIIADCVLSNIPVLCLQDLKNICANNFGISTSCLGIQECLKDLVDKIKDISLRSQAKVANDKIETETNDIKEVTIENKMDIDSDNNVTTFSYLYRTSKKSRVFIPNNSQENRIKEFGGQHFIKFSEPAPESHSESKKFKKMIVKRIANNPNRVKVKNK